MDVSGQKMSTRKYFIAIVIPEPAQREIEHIKQKLFTDCGLKGALRSPAHITLHRPFEWKEKNENVLIQKLRLFKFDRSFTVELDNFDVFEPRVIFVNVVKNEMLKVLHDELAAFCKRELHLFNEFEDKRGFHPHVTIAFRDLKKPLFYSLKDEFLSRQMKGSFVYKEFSLLKLDKRWEVLENFQLLT